MFATSALEPVPFETGIACNAVTASFNAVSSASLVVASALILSVSDLSASSNDVIFVEVIPLVIAAHCSAVNDELLRVYSNAQALLEYLYLWYSGLPVESVAMTKA